MTDHISFKLPKKLEKILAALTEYFVAQHDQLMQRVIVNSKYHVVLARSSTGIFGRLFVRDFWPLRRGLG
ncbi:MAG TPA: hypothetical protein VNT79_10480 [Phycisphaerae bacterium]|nr:hypothetical protein [Phycisphaerae bacterium]